MYIHHIFHKTYGLAFYGLLFLNFPKITYYEFIASKKLEKFFMKFVKDFNFLCKTNRQTFLVMFIIALKIRIFLPVPVTVGIAAQKTIERIARLFLIILKGKDNKDKKNI